MNPGRSSMVGLLACAAVLATGAMAKDPTESGASILSLRGNHLRCNVNAEECRILVRVEPKGAGCEASVDIAQANVKGQRPVIWMLVKSDMTDHNVYEFINDGIEWIKDADDPNPPADPDGEARKRFKYKGSAVGGTPVSAWESTAVASDPNRFHAYKPRVRIKGQTGKCSASDPKIANDG